ncbi:LysM peptidoglycan-binding domain-containing protein [Novosphingobium sp. MW5]|nr:LysM peptidoglycan-binding domain-containing protein [Novosphingobium sp. MW5]
MQPGDTLQKVTQQCRVALPELMAANPQIGNVRNIAVGTRINIPGATGGDDDARLPHATRKVAPGDTLFSLAESLGTSVDALLEANPDLEMDDLPVGLTIRIPRFAPGGPDGPIAKDPTINVQPRAGGPRHAHHRERRQLPSRPDSPDRCRAAGTGMALARADAGAGRR